MLLLLRKLTFSKALPLIWTLVTTGLLCLPGSSLPEGSFEKIHNFDKLIHLALFGGVTLLWGSYYHQHVADDARWFQLILSTSAATTLLGVGLEYVQHYWIPKRSFDRGDILADVAGIIAAWGFLIITRRK